MCTLISVVKCTTKKHVLPVLARKDSKSLKRER